MRALIGLFARPLHRTNDWPGAVERIASGAAFLSQGSVYSYLRARTLLAGPRLFQDDGFAEALERCKWEGFAVAVQDLILMLERDLRRDLDGPLEAVARAWEALHADALHWHPLPDHRQDWDDRMAAFGPRLRAAMAEPPQDIEKIAAATAAELMAHAPVEDSIRLSDLEMVTNNTAFRFVDFKRRLTRDVDLDALAGLLAERAR